MEMTAACKQNAEEEMGKMVAAHDTTFAPPPNNSVYVTVIGHEPSKNRDPEEFIQYVRSHN